MQGNKILGGQTFKKILKGLKMTFENLIDTNNLVMSFFLSVTKSCAWNLVTTLEFFVLFHILK